MWLVTNASLLPATILQVTGRLKNSVTILSPYGSNLTGRCYLTTIAIVFLASMENWWKTLLTNQDGDDEVRVKLDQGGEELTVPRDSIYQVLTLILSGAQS